MVRMVDSLTEYLPTTGLYVGYSSRREKRILFKDLNLALRPGTLVCFMGPNGIGKSSLIRTLAGLQKPLQGTVAMPPDPSRQIAVVLTDRIAAPGMTVYDVVAYGRYPYLGWNLSLNDEDKKIIGRAIEVVGLEDLREERVYALSDGQLQMVMIARALAQDTPVILLDEPTAHLDLNNRVEVMKLLKTLASTTHRAILVSTHDLDLALQMADLIWLAGAEKNIITGVPEDLVLNGAFDDIFKFKGFDLKTGKVLHEVTRLEKITLTGEGYEYLWTKNAIERCGYEVVHAGGTVHVTIEQEGDSLQWRMNKAGRQQLVRSVDDLLRQFDQTFADTHR